jgi:hypothetical protein
MAESTESAAIAVVDPLYKRLWVQLFQLFGNALFCQSADRIQLMLFLIPRKDIALRSTKIAGPVPYMKAGETKY